jgi:hypothetical protein
MVRRRGEGLMRAECEITAKGLLSALGETCRRRDVGWSDFWKWLREEYEIVSFEEVVDHGAPNGDATVEERVAVFAEGWGMDELILAAGGPEGDVEQLGEFGPELFVVVGVDPEHGSA